MDKFQVVEYNDGKRMGEVAAGIFRIDGNRTEHAALTLAIAQMKACSKLAERYERRGLKLTYGIERVTVTEVSLDGDAEPGEDVRFSLASSVRSAHPDGPWLLLFQPEVPDGWMLGRVEITARGNIQIEIRPKRGGET